MERKTMVIFKYYSSKLKKSKHLDPSYGRRHIGNKSLTWQQELSFTIHSCLALHSQNYLTFDLVSLLITRCYSVAQSCPTLCDPMDCSMPGFPVLHCLPEFAPTQVPCVDDANPTISSSVAPFSTSLNLFQHQGLFQ